MSALGANRKHFLAIDRELNVHPRSLGQIAEFSVLLRIAFLANAVVDEDRRLLGNLESEFNDLLILLDILDLDGDRRFGWIDPLDFAGHLRTMGLNGRDGLAVLCEMSS